MSKLRLPIWTLLALVVLFAVGLGALKNPSELVASAVFSLAVLSLCVALVVALASVGPRRLALLALAIFGWPYLGLTFFGQVVQTPRFVLSGWVAAGLDHLERMIDASLPVASNRGTVFNGSGTTFVIDVKVSPQYRQIEKSTEFRQIGHSLATLLVGLVAALVILLFIKSDRSKHSGTHALKGS